MSSSPLVRPTARKVQLHSLQNEAPQALCSQLDALVLLAGKAKAVQFPFNLVSDRVATVAEEMVDELKLDPAILQELNVEITNAIRQAVKETVGVDDWVEGTLPAGEEGARSRLRSPSLRALALQSLTAAPAAGAAASLASTAQPLTPPVRSALEPRKLPS